MLALALVTVQGLWGSFGSSGPPGSGISSTVPWQTPFPAPATSADFAAMLAQAAARNESLLRYVYPMAAEIVPDVRVHWGYQHGCEVRYDCWCYHVRGDMSSSVNPDGWKECARLQTVADQCPRDENNCGCFSGPQCIFSDMRPTKTLTAIASARLAGVDHIIEEGRFGGLSAYMYALHGFRVTSVEFLPLDGPTKALHLLAPDIRMVDGDGSVIVPALVANMTDAEARRTMVIFDGEKRTGALPTHAKVHDRIGLAIFDDTNSKVDGPQFLRHLEREGHVFVNTWHPAFKRFIFREKDALSQISALVGTQPQRPVRWQGGIANLKKAHFTIVKGGGWK